MSPSIVISISGIAGIVQPSGQDQIFVAMLCCLSKV